MTLLLNLGLVIALCIWLCGCGGQPGNARRVSSDDVEIALYTIQHDKSKVEMGSGATHSEFVDIDCREAFFSSWACSVALANGARVSCMIDRIQADREIVIRGRVHCS